LSRRERKRRCGDAVAAAAAAAAEAIAQSVGQSDAAIMTESGGTRRFSVLRRVLGQRAAWPRCHVTDCIIVYISGRGGALS